MGITKTIKIVDIRPMKLNITNMLAAIISVAPISPQPDSHRGMRFDL